MSACRGRIAEAGGAGERRGRIAEAGWASGGRGSAGARCPKVLGCVSEAEVLG